MKFIQKISVCLLMTGCAATQAQAVVAVLSTSRFLTTHPSALCYTVTIPSSGTFTGESLFNTDLPFSNDDDGFTILAKDENDTPGGGPGGDFNTDPKGVPEPASAGLILLGAAGMLLRRKVK